MALTNEQKIKAMCSAPLSVIHEQCAMYRSGQVEGPRFDAELAKLRESYAASVGTVDWDRGLEVLLSSGVPVSEARAGDVRRRRAGSLEEHRSFELLRESGIPVADAPEDVLVDAAVMADAFEQVANAISPVPIKLIGDDGELPSREQVDAAIELAEDLRAASDESLLESVGASVEAGEIREAAAKRRAGRGRIS
jgi:hypothetical protein